MLLIVFTDGGCYVRQKNMIRSKDIAFLFTERTVPFEYLCSDCRQLRLSLVLTDKCGNCESTKITKGKIGTLKRGK